MLSLKTKLGQFFTTKANYILQGFEKFVTNKDVVDPFCGNQDLLNWAKNFNAKSILGYDIDNNYVDNKITFYNNSISNPKYYDFVITNPPYLYINYNHNKEIFHNTKHSDLYHLAIQSLLNSNEGILIVPINFLSSLNAKYIRQQFFEKFNIIKANFFTKAVFEDTTISVVSFYYQKKLAKSDICEFEFNIYPQKISTLLKLNKKYNWQIGGDFLQSILKTPNVLNLQRLTLKDINNNQGNYILNASLNHLNKKADFYVSKEYKNFLSKNILILKAIDSGTTTGKIALQDIREYNIDCLISLHTSRNQIQILNNLNIMQQEYIIKEFNNILNNARILYYDSFMTNFRDNNRKRISFNFAYKLINYIYLNHLQLKQQEILC